MIHVLISLYFLSPLHAAITDWSVTGASREYENTGDTDLFEYWGGVDSTCVGTSTCNTCGAGAVASPVVKSCNEAAINQFTTISFTFKSDKTTTDTRYFIITKDTDTSPEIENSASTVAPNQSGTLTVVWNLLCAALDAGANPTCAGNSNTPTVFRVGIDSNADNKLDSNDDFKRIKIGTLQEAAGAGAASRNAYTCAGDAVTAGICDYYIYPGDKKVFLATYGFATGFPTITPNTYTAIRFYYSPVASAAVNCNTATDFTYNAFGELSLSKSGSSFTSSFSGDGSITGLANETTYCFRSAVVDIAGNIRGFTNTSDLTDLSRATPSEVVGLLEEGNCFIATAAYGNPLEDKIETFRRFRDEVLLNFSLGKKLVAFYYENSKPLALEIFKYSWAQKLTQMILWPIWFALEIILNYPIVLVLAGLGLLISAMRRRNAI